MSNVIKLFNLPSYHSKNSSIYLSFPHTQTYFAKYFRLELNEEAGKSAKVIFFTDVMYNICFFPRVYAYLHIDLPHGMEKMLLFC